jgi:hypothetical protein
MTPGCRNEVNARDTNVLNILSGFGNRIIAPGEEIYHRQGPVQCRQRLGGLLRYYYREAA